MFKTKFPVNELNLTKAGGSPLGYVERAGRNDIVTFGALTIFRAAIHSNSNG